VALAVNDLTGPRWVHGRSVLSGDESVLHASGLGELIVRAGRRTDSWHHLCAPLGGRVLIRAEKAVELNPGSGRHAIVPAKSSVPAVVGYEDTHL
jgi:hypothetical protein